MAAYTVSSNKAGKVAVQFGLDTTYGLTTWTQPVSQGGATTLLVAGMRATSTIAWRAVVQFSDGTRFVDSDHTFTTGPGDPSQQATTLTAATSPGKTPQSGVELLTWSPGTARPTVTDLSGNILWTYTAVPNGTSPNPVKLLPNGHFLINFSAGTVDGLNSVIQEVDLRGNVIWQMTAADLNTALLTATCAGCNITVVGTHHDFAILPNGHLIVCHTQGDMSGATVTGDALIDLDQNHNPVWLWNEFDHLDITGSRCVSRLDPHQRDPLFGGRRQPDHLHPSPELAGED